jgi:hypothetical protein
VTAAAEWVHPYLGGALPAAVIRLPRFTPLYRRKGIQAVGARTDHVNADHSHPNGHLECSAAEGLQDRHSWVPHSAPGQSLSAVGTVR